MLRLASARAVLAGLSQGAWMPRHFDLQKIAEIRAAFARLGSKNAVAAELGVHRNSVARALAKDLSLAPLPRAKKKHRLDEPIERLLSEGKGEARRCAKQTPTARRIGDLLRAAGIETSQRTVDRRVALARARLNCARQNEAMLLLGKPSGCAQCDFGKVAAWIGGRLKELNVLILSFPHSNAAFACATETQSSCCFFEGLAALFDAAGGVPRRLRFDNLSPAVKRLRGSERELTEGFSRFRAHFAFEAEFCSPAKGNEKGHVESKVAYIRNNFFSLGLKHKSLDELNAALLSWCRADMAREHYRFGQNIAALFEEDESQLLALPSKPFEFFEQRIASTNAQGFAAFDGNFYFASKGMANATVLVRATAKRVELLGAETLAPLASYARSYDKNKHFQPILALAEMLAQKPAALPYVLGSEEQGRAALLELKSLRASERVGAIAQALVSSSPAHLSLKGFGERFDFIPDLKKYDLLLRRP